MNSAPKSPPHDDADLEIEDGQSFFPAAGGKRKLRFRAVFVSDIHLGTADSKVAEVSHFLRNSYCDTLVLNGDIIDGWSLKRGARWTKAHTFFIREILNKMEKGGTEVIYLRGNHDDMLSRFIPMRFENVQLLNEYIYETDGRRYLVVHGDGFDVITTHFRWISVIGSVGYDLLLKLNRVKSKWRETQGKRPASLSKKVKAKVKSAVNYISNFETQLQRLAASKNCGGIICGHIHTAADKMIGDVHYLNSGDWVESLTAVVEHMDGTFEVITYEDFCERSHRQPRGRGDQDEDERLDSLEVDEETERMLRSL